MSASNDLHLAILAKLRERSYAPWNVAVVIEKADDARDLLDRLFAGNPPGDGQQSVEFHVYGAPFDLPADAPKNTLTCIVTTEEFWHKNPEYATFKLARSENMFCEHLRQRLAPSVRSFGVSSWQDLVIFV